MTAPAFAPAGPGWLGLLEHAIGACAAHDRSDLARSLRRRRARLLDPQLRVMVVGEAKQGKSQLINALLGAAVCPAGDAPGERVATLVQHADTPGTQASGLYAEVGVPRDLLAGGLALIEAPALDRTDPLPALAGTAELTGADTVVLVTEATRELSAGELALLGELGKSYPAMAVAVTKTDLAPDWRGVLERNRRRLAEAGVPAYLLALSATLRLHATRTGDQALNAESGFPQLVAYLRRTTAGKAERFAPVAAGLAARAALADLAAALREEQRPDAMSRLHEAQRALEEVRRCATRWQYTLADEVADVVSDIEFDLRERTRAILRKAEQALETADPDRGWRSFADWLDGTLRDTAEANLGALGERIERMAVRVAGEFPPGTVGHLPQWTPGVLRDAPGRLDPLGRPTMDRLSLSQRVFTGLRGSYGGVLMFGLATGLAGMPLINPVSVGAGALFAGKSIRDESRTTRKRRQAAVKAAVQRHVDDVFVRLNKDGKDAIRHAQRVLRGHFTDLTEELQQAVVESARTAKQAVDDDARRTQHDLAQLTKLYQRATALSAGR